MSNTLIIHQPDWVEHFVSNLQGPFVAPKERIRIAIQLSHENLVRATGGPFGAAVFDMDSGALISAGVNYVVPGNCSIAHAEMVAIALAQQKLQTFDLSSRGRFELASSCQPCAMCLGAIPWSGIRSLLCAAGEEDARAVGFDEGAKPNNWQQELQKGGITVTENLMRLEAAAVLQEYHRSSGIIYNPSGCNKH